MSLTVTELREHAERLRADLEHKRREIRSHGSGAYDRDTLTRQCAALSDRVDEIIRELDDFERLQPTAATAPAA